ncbi:MAG TPA: helix-turn-helix domain-containing protein [Gammaproteobacteria bacterium]|nr:helix-turn-helix domain-containing protein [Gammaproteobacteria bacterium]
MARKSRIHVPGGTYYVILRGQSGKALFPEERDRERFLELLDEVAARYRAHTLAYALLERRVEMVVRIEELPLYKFVQSLIYRYKRALRGIHGGVGTLLQGRYQACLLDPAEYLAPAIAHCHTAPVRAGLSADAGSWRWTGHDALAGRGAGPAALAVDAALAAFGAPADAGRRRYRALAADPAVVADQDHLGARLARERILGDERFCRRIQRQQKRRAGSVPTLDRIVRYVCEAYALTEAELKSPRRLRRPAQARAVIGLIATETGAATLTDVASRFGRDIATLSISMRRLTQENVDGYRRARRLRDELRRAAQ